MLPNDERWKWWHGKSQQRVEKQRSGCLDHRYANQQHSSKLQFQWVDWYWHGLLFWHEQSGFNHDERAHH